ncbi:MAG TPA: adenylate/guanylate cyclase domain-containing protein [Candidatus Baltobacteraceae bacterium]|nr:adenylate/guanylate cyclase domain-containing protein [Candidatus Baltobacteraceae bacterium]
MGRALPALMALLVAMVLIGLPFAVWLDLRDLTSSSLERQATNLSTVISGIRDFYASNVVDRVLAADGHAFVTAHYLEHPGGIPIPSKFSLELAHVIGNGQATYRYRFISHYPFRGTAAHPFDAFEEAALASLERNPRQTLTNVAWNGMTSQVSYATPIMMEAGCVACHNASPDSPKRDWSVGQVGGIQELIVTERAAYNVSGFRYLLLYFVFLAIIGFGAIALQRRQSRETRAAYAFVSSISQKISKYISPQIYQSIFSGRTGTEIATTRKKLTIFFSDIKDFTSTSERLQPETLTALLNEYFTEMSAIALGYGGTIDKFVGDAILVFFGDPESRGESEDALACVFMAIAMQARLTELNARWRSQGIEDPFRVRMGINTGYCSVGNFGSLERMDYTIIGAEANLAARLESIAEPGTIVVSYETYALVRGAVHAHALAPIRVKGISREVIPYVIEGYIDGPAAATVFSERGGGLEFYLDVDGIEDPKAVRALLEDAIRALDARKETE